MTVLQTPKFRRQVRGLLLHERSHRTTHPRRLVNRTASWGEPPVDGRCRWCYENTSTLKRRWHSYCLTAYWIASGQKPDEIQHTLCEICGNIATELDHRLSIVVARTLGRGALLRAFSPGNLRWLCKDCHRGKTRQDRRLAKFLSACDIDWHTAKRIVQRHGAWAQAFMMPCSLEAQRTAGIRS